ncbi:MAG: DUF3987 domain-containing protein [Chitinophagaceae bacterium]|nr:DUF3987 domain-containing protein [Chitinophagaceae bacterium]
MASCTIFKNFTVPVEKKSLLLIGNDIASGKYKAEVEEIRTLLEQGKTEEAANKKKQLLAFTPSAVFTEKRQMPFLEMYSGFVHLDFDKLTPEQLSTAFKVISEIPYTFLCFISPSGNGLKVFIEVNTCLEHHDTAYLQVQKHYEDATELKADPSCKDVTRLCFMSYHPEAYRTIQNEKFIVTLPQIIQEQQTLAMPALKQVEQAEPENLDVTFLFNQQIQFTNQKASYTDGNRNNYIYLLASNCNRVGISQPDTELLCSQYFDLPEREILEAVKSAYTHHAGEFAKFAKSAKLQPAKPNTQPEDEDPLEDFLKTTPTIPDEVYEALPHILKEGSIAFSDKRKRDVFFTGAIAIISGCLPKVTGIYFQERVHPHLYTFIIAPAASGKGVLKNAKRLADKYHQQVLGASREAQKRHDAEMVDYKELQRNRKKGEPAPEKPNEPPFKIVFIPADSSHSRMIEHLQNNDGQGIICETEADTMSGAKKQDWGDYSPALRAAFHHEKITLTRKTNNEYIEINEPRLAVALSGTPAQAPKLIASAEDGLFSRFLFYAFKNEIVWQDPSPQSHTIVYNDHFDALSQSMLDMIGFLEQSPTAVQLQPEQWQVLNTTFSGILSEVTIFTSEEASGIVYRLGLIMFRLCMIFSALRKFENGEVTDTIFCTDEDFNTALAIAQTYLQHSLLMFNNLPKQNEVMSFQSGDSKRKFFEALPEEFTRKQATELGSQFKLSARSVDEILKTATGVSLTKLKAGLYRKS